jgi:YidC/Oxa1 family membrane protein insertase
MEGQGKRLLLAVALALGVMLVWNMVFPTKKDEPPPPPTTLATGSGSNVTVPPASQVGVPEIPVAPSAGSGSGSGSSAPAAVVQPAAIEAPRGPEQKITLAFPDRFTATFSSYGGALTSWKLADPRFEKDKTHGELLSPEIEKSGAFLVNFNRGSTYVIPQFAEWKGTKVSDTEVSYTLATPDLEVTKTFTIVPDAYLVKMVVKVTAKVPAGKEAREQLAITSFAFQDPKKIEEGSARGAEPRAWTSSTYRDGTIVQTPIKDVIASARYEPSIKWTGFEHPYLLAAYAPNLAPGQIAEKQTFPEEPTGLMRTDILLSPPFVLKQGNDTATQEIVGYLGPKNYASLEHADEAAGFSPGFKHTIDLGWFAFIGRPLLWLLLKFYAFFGNWGVAIILLTFLVKAATLYWTTKSMRSMKAMAALAPQMKEIQAKYKDDRQRQQAETMALYKQHNVNPIAGCLPILLQMPIWLALYRMLSNAGELYQQPFIPGWINDLTSPDPTHILPIVLVITMFLQARLTPQTGSSGQQKMLQYGMPLMFGVMSFFFPAGLTLYIFTNTCLSALHSVYMNKFDKKSLAIAAQLKKNADAAAAVTAAAAKGKPGAGGAKNGAPKAAKPVIDVDSVDSTDDGDEEEAPSATASASGRGSPNPRKRKKRRR